MSINTSARGTALQRLGVGASVACAIHCAAVPVLAAVLPALGAGWIASPVVEGVLLGGAAVVAALTLGAGALRHRRPGPLLAAVAGLVVLAAGDRWGAPPLATGVAGAVLLGGAQLANRRLLGHNCGRP